MPYSDAFYDQHISASYRSAKIYLEHLYSLFSPKVVADIGCGRGAWLKACGEFGADRLVGIDGDWNRQENMIDDRIAFTAFDLDQEIQGVERADLAISLEVGEHLKPSSARGFVKSLTDISDVVLFSAAYPKQGGTGHSNEQPQTYWAAHFADFGFVPFDIFRPKFWGDERVEYWYRQNTFLYVLQGSAAFSEIGARGVSPLVDTGFMDCVHPYLYERHTRSLPAKILREMKRRLGS